MLLSTSGETLRRVLNDRAETMPKEGRNNSRGAGGLRPNRSCIDHVHTIGKIIRERKDAGVKKKRAICF